MVGQASRELWYDAPRDSPDHRALTPRTETDRLLPSGNIRQAALEAMPNLFLGASCAEVAST